MKPCSLCWKQKTWGEAGFSFKRDFMKTKEYKRGVDLWAVDLPTPSLTQYSFAFSLAGKEFA